MSVVLDYNPENRILYLTVLNELNTKKIADSLKKIRNSNDYPPDAGILMDVSSINTTINNIQLCLESAGIQEIIIEREKAKIAIIACNFPSTLRNKYDMLAESAKHKIVVFNNFIEAEEWLEWREQ